MRPIKFRGKDTITHKWLYDDMIYFDAKAVDLDTVGQFTGLHDMSGQEIYEGDIIEITDPNTNEKYISTVIWSRKGYYAAKMENNGNITLGYVDKSQIRIIGNIYDNPELLRQINDGEKELPRRPE